MNILLNQHRIACRAVTLLALIVILTVLSARIRADAGNCGGDLINLPFTDVTSNNIFFCAIAEAYISGLTNGTSATTFSPAAPVPREQMAAFITRTLDQSLERGSRRAALKQWDRPTSVPLSATTIVGSAARAVASDGADLWVANHSGTVSRVRASDGKLLETWTGAPNAFSVLVARGRIFVLSDSNPGKLYRIDPRQPAGAVSLVATLGPFSAGIATDGESIWVANNGTNGADGSVSKVNPDTGVVQTFTLGFDAPINILYDGANIWVTDGGIGTADLRKLNNDGSIAQSVTLGNQFLGNPVFDGVNIWVPMKGDNMVAVVRAATGATVAMLTKNGLNAPGTAAFDGQQILITNESGASVSLWQATDLTPLGSFSTGGTPPAGACSDGVNFWITIGNSLARF
jgi:hypothetical protein